MSKNVRGLTPAVIFLKDIKPRERKIVVNHLTRSHLKGLTEVAVNIVKSSVPLTSDELKTCRRWRKSLKLLALKRYPAKEKKKILQRGGFLGAILPILASVLGAVIGST